MSDPINWEKGDFALTSSGQIVELQWYAKTLKYWWCISEDGHHAFAVNERLLTHRIDKDKP